jgi:transcriptional regulator with XRE-family HTH domain
MTVNEQEARGAGDLGRRAARRREELGLSIEEVAARARMDPGYVDYLERRPAHLSAESLLRLAGALRTSAASLLGERTERLPRERGTGRERPGLEKLQAGECLRLISGGGVGRVVMVTADGPTALPVTYVLDRGGVVFRTEQDTDLAMLAGGEAGFEVDHFDPGLRGGWSVLVTGRVDLIHDPAAIRRLRELIDPLPGGQCDIYVRIDPRCVTGRRVRHDRGSGVRR